MSNSSQLSELDELRCQVANLSRELAKQKRMPDKEEQQLDPEILTLRHEAGVLRAIIKGTAGAAGKEAIRLIVQQLADALKVRHVFVGEWHEDQPDRVQVLAAWFGTGYVEPFEYCLQGTPCQNVFEQRVCLYASDVQWFFPGDHQLAERQVQSYCGVPLRDRVGKPLGLLVVMDEKPMHNAAFIEEIASMVAERAASEIERSRIEQERFRSLDLLRNVMETVPDIIFQLDLQGNLVRWNKRMELVTGLRPEELKNRPALAFVPEAEYVETAAAIQRAFHEGYAELEGHLLANAEQLIPYLWTGAVLKDNGGQVIGVTGVGRDISERKKAEQTLADDHKRLQDILDAMFGFVALYTTDGRIVEINQTPLKMGNISKGDVMGQYFWDTPWWSGLPDMQLCLKDWMDRAVQGERVRGELVFRMADGGLATVDVTFGPLRNQEGAITHVIGFGVDITDRKQAELKLEQAQEALKLTQFSVDHAVDGFFWIGPDARILNVNEAACRLLEYSREELTSMTVHDIDPNFPPEVWSAHWEELKTKGAITFESKHWSSSGKVLETEVTVNYLQYGGKEFNCAIMRDIGERKRIDSALRVNKERLDLVLRATNDGVWDWNILTGDDYLSPQWKALLGFANQELPNNEKSFFQRLHPDDVDQVKEALKAHFQESSPYDLEARLQHRDGSYRWFHVRGEAIRDIEGRPCRMVGSITDIADRKHAELRERERLNHVIKFKEAQLRLDRLAHGDLSQDFQAITHIGAEIVGVERVSIWLYDSGGSTLVCQDLYEQSLARHSAGAVLEASRYPHYFEALERGLPLAATDACADRRTSKFAAGYLEPFGIVSMMDVAVCQDGQIIGVICFEHVGAMREWSSEEQAFTVSLTDHVTFCLAREERRQTEEALRASEERFSKAFHEAAIGMALVSPDGHWLQVNRALCNILGYSPEELVASAVQAIMHPGDRYAYSRFVEGLLNGELRTFHLETRYLHKQGVTVWTIISLSLVRTAGGIPQHIVAQFQDITERKQVEVLLQSSQEKLQQALNASKTGLWDWNTETNEVSFSREWKDQLGYDEGGLLDAFDTWESRLHPEDHSRVLAYVRAYLTNPQGPYQQEFRLRHKDGNYRWIEARAAFVTETNGRRVRLLGSHADITERKREEEERLRRETLFSLMLNTGPGCIKRVAADGSLLSMNPAGLRMIELNEGEAIGCCVFDLVTPQCRASFIDMHQAVIKGESRALQFEIQGGHGTRRWMETYAVPFMNPVNGVTEHLAVTHDITERKQTEKALRLSLERFDLAVTASQDGLWDAQVVADDPFNPHNPIYYSPRMKDIMGVQHGPETDVLGVWASLVHPDDRSRIFAALTAHLVRREPYDVEYRIVKPAGDIRWISARGQAQWSHTGQPIRMSGSFCDITERKQAEEMLRQRERDLQTALDERERIGQDLHDGILQSLYATGLVLESCRPLFAETGKKRSMGSDVMATFNRAIRQLNQVMSEIRNFIAGLESQILQGVDFATTIHAMVDSICAGNASCRVRIDKDATCKISTEQAYHLVNMTREALSNSLRHSHATQIAVSLVQNPSSVRLSITDNGIGFDPDTAYGIGHGLSNMRARARKIHARLTVQSRASQGTRIVVDLLEEPDYAAHQN